MGCIVESSVEVCPPNGRVLGRAYSMGGHILKDCEGVCQSYIWGVCCWRFRAGPGVGPMKGCVRWIC